MSTPILFTQTPGGDSELEQANFPFRDKEDKSSNAQKSDISEKRGKEGDMNTFGKGEGEWEKEKRSLFFAGIKRLG